MTMTAKEKIISIALNEVGYEESPPNSNKTKYGKFIGMDGVPWCGIFVSWCYVKAGQAIKGAGLRLGFSGCQYAVANISKWGRKVSEPESGDVVFYDWNNDGRYDHTGLYIQWLNKGQKFQAVEGNTSIGNDSNGGKVMVRERSAKGVIFVRPNSKL